MTVDELHDELEQACMEVMDGAPASRLQASRVRRAVGDVMRRHGLKGTVEVLAGGQVARVRLAPRAPEAKQVVITVHAR